MAIAAGILAMIVSWSVFPSRTPVQAAVMVREARVALANVTDRHYRSRATLRPEVLAVHPQLKQLTAVQSDLWTRGDRVHAHVVGLGAPFDWGREASGRTWVVPNDRLGLTFEPEAIPDSLALAADLLSLRPDILLDEMLANYEMTEQPADPTDGGEVIRIKATPRPGHATPRLITATLDLDKTTKVLRRLTLARGPRGRATFDVAFTLIDTQTQDDDTYKVEGHLVENAEIVGAERPGRRRQLMLRHLGPLTRILSDLRGSRVVE